MAALHGQHGLHGALGLGGIAIGHQGEQALGHDLPGQAEPVLHHPHWPSPFPYWLGIYKPHTRRFWRGSCNEAARFA